jgi:hypothetical protein
MTLSVACIFFGRGRHPLYPISLDVETLHTKMYNLGNQYVVPCPNIAEELELHVVLMWYLSYAGKNDLLPLHCEIAAEGCDRMGYFNESHESWRGIDEDERERKRLLAWSVIVGCS